MKDILIAEHLKVIKKTREWNSYTAESEAAKLSSEVTRKHMKGFAEWAVREKKYESYKDADYWFDQGGEDVGTTEQLIDKYFESLNK